MSFLMHRSKKEQGKGKGRGKGRRDKATEAPPSPGAEEQQQEDGEEFDIPEVVSAHLTTSPLPSYKNPFSHICCFLSNYLLCSYTSFPPPLLHSLPYLRHLSPQNGDGVPEDEVWSVDTSEEAVKARMENLSEQASALALTSDLDKTVSERVDLFFKFVEVREGWVWQ